VQFLSGFPRPNPSQLGGSRIIKNPQSDQHSRLSTPLAEQNIPKFRGE